MTSISKNEHIDKLDDIVNKYNIIIYIITQLKWSRLTLVALIWVGFLGSPIWGDGLGLKLPPVSSSLELC